MSSQYPHFDAKNEENRANVPPPPTLPPTLSHPPVPADPLQPGSDSPAPQSSPASAPEEPDHSAHELQTFDDPPFDPNLYLTPTDKDAEQQFASRCSLTQLQLDAIELIVNGCNDTQVAHRLHLDRKTIWRWKTFDPEFAAELHRARAQAASWTADRYQTRLNVATDILYELLQESDPHLRFKAAYAMLTMSHNFRRNTDPIPETAPEPKMEKIAR